MTQKDRLEYLKGKSDLLEQFCMASATGLGNGLKEEREELAFRPEGACGEPIPGEGCAVLG